MAKGRRQKAEEEEKKFITTDKPLSAAQGEELAKIKARDVKDAIASADEELKPFLEAKQKRGQKAEGRRQK